MWSEKDCASCAQRKHPMIECPKCHSNWYCSKRCMQTDFPRHEASCQFWTDQIIAVARSKIYFDNQQIGRGMQNWDYPYYFGATPALDLLNLADNELKDWGQTPRGSPKMSLCLVGCNDLRNVIYTVASLPDEFKGCVNFVLDDMDPFVMARNLMLVYMMTLEDAPVSSIATIWFSTRLPSGDFAFLQKTLSELIHVLSARQLKDMTHGIISITEESFQTMKQVFTGCQQTTCKRKDKKCIKLDLQRRSRSMVLSVHDMEEAVVTYLARIPDEHHQSIRAWFENGIIIPTDQRHDELLYFNPTLTGRPKLVVENEAKPPPPFLWHFEYCVRPNCIPFAFWDYLELKKQGKSKSIPELCHAYVTKMIRRLVKLLNESRLQFQMYVEDFRRLREILPYGEIFDRVYTSNLADYYGNKCIIDYLEPLLSKSNPHAVLFTEVRNWGNFVDGTEVKPSQSQDLTDEVSRQKRFSPLIYQNVPHFFIYLRGDHLASIQNDVTDITTSLCTIPSLSEGMSINGLRMRDPRYQRNHVLSFTSKGHNIPLNIFKCRTRHLEWYRVDERTESTDL